MLYHVHAKDTYIDLGRTARDGVLATTDQDDPRRSWRFATVGYGHDATFWKEFVSTLRVVGYDGVLSIEHEDPLAPVMEGLGRTVELLRGAIWTEHQRLALVARRSAEPDHPGESDAAELMVMKLSMIHWMREEPLEQTVARLASAGYHDSLEINGEPDHYDAVEVRDILDRHGIVLWGAVTLMEHGGRDMVHPDRFVRVGTQRYLQDTIQLIADLGGQVLCCVPSTIGKTQPLTTPSTEWQWCIDGLRAAGEFAGERGVRIALEPTTRFETYLLNRAEQALAMVEDVGLSNVELPGHLPHAPGGARSASGDPGGRRSAVRLSRGGQQPATARTGGGRLDPILRVLDETGYTRPT